MVIPPNQVNWETEGYCVGDCTSEVNCSVYFYLHFHGEKKVETDLVRKQQGRVLVQSYSLNFYLVLWLSSQLFYLYLVCFSFAVR